MTKPDIRIDCLTLGMMQTNSYVVRAPGVPGCWVFDPGMGVVKLLAYLREEALTVERVVLTHGHVDHIAGVGKLLEAFGDAILVAPAGDASMLADPAENLSVMLGASLTVPAPTDRVDGGDELLLGSAVWHVLATPGHTPGGVSYYCPDAGVVIVGDSLFAGSVGRCDFPGGDMAMLVGSIRRQLLTLPTETRVLPGHGPETTIGAEASGNPYL